MTTEKTEVVIRCEVLTPHSRVINGTLYMLEPMLSGIVALPDDEDTRKSIARGLLRLCLTTADGKAQNGGAR
jgi:hypothetical protein